MIPAVRTWKVTNKVTSRSIEVMTINKRFARMIAASDFGMWGQPCTVSLVKPKDNGWRITDNINMVNGAA